MKPDGSFGKFDAEIPELLAEAGDHGFAEVTNGQREYYGNTMGILWEYYGNTWEHYGNGEKRCDVTSDDRSEDHI